MRILLIICMVLVAVSALPAFAQILDTAPDRIAFCADPVGNVPGVCDLFTPHAVYLMITRPSDPSGLTGYECSFQIPPIVTSLGFIPAGGIIIQGTFPDLAVGYSTPLPAIGDTYILGTWNLMLTGTAVDFVVLRQFLPGQQYFASYTTAAAGPIPVQPPDWGNGMPMGEPWASAVLWLNEPTFCGYIVEEEQVLWGGVKSLFR